MKNIRFLRNCHKKKFTISSHLSSFKLKINGTVKWLIGWLVGFIAYQLLTNTEVIPLGGGGDYV